MRTQERLVQEISQLESSRNQASVAVVNVLDLLEKADSRRRAEGDRPWNRILDNLENTLDLTRARLTTYEQLLKERRRDLERLLQNGKSPVAEHPLSDVSLEETVLIDTLREVLPEDVPLPANHILAAERILAMPLDLLGNMTLDEVAQMNAQLLEESEAESAKAPQGQQATVTKKTWLEQRVQRAKQTREALAANRRSELTFGERRRQVALRNAIEKMVSGNFVLLDLNEVEMLGQCLKDIEQKPEKTDMENRLKSVLERCSPKLNERASELRRRRAQSYLRKPFPKAP